MRFIYWLTLASLFLGTCLNAQHQASEHDISVGVGKASFTKRKSLNLGVIEGVVTFSDSGKVAPGTYVRLMNPFKIFMLQEPWMVETDERGWFRFENLPVGLAYTVFASFENQVSSKSADQLTIVNLRKQGQHVNVALKLEPSSKIIFSVIEEHTGKPVQDALIQLGNLGLNPYQTRVDLYSQAQVNQLAKTDEQGRARLAFFEGKTRVTISKKGFVPLTQDLFTKTPNQTPVIFRMAPSVTVTGKVIDEAGLPLISYRLDDGQKSRFIHNPDGYFELNHVPRGKPLALEFMKEGYLDVTLDDIRLPLFAEKHHVDVQMYALGEQQSKQPEPSFPKTNQSISLWEPWKPEKPLQLIFKNEKGEILKDMPFQFTHSGNAGHGRSDQAGRVFLELGLQMGSKAFLHLLIKNQAPKYLTIGRDDLESRDQPVEVVFDPGANITLQVQDSQGVAIPGVQIYCIQYGLSLLATMGGATATDKQGRLELKHLPPQAKISTDAEGFKYKSLVVKDVLAAKGKITLERESLIKCRLVDEAGVPVTSFQVKLLGMRKGGSTSYRKMELQVEDDQGYFELRKLEPNVSLRLFIDDKKGRMMVAGPLFTDLFGQETLKTLVLKQASYAIEKQVLDSKENPIAGARVWGAIYEREPSGEISKWHSGMLMAEGLATFERFTDELGRFRIDNIPAGLKAAYYVEAPGRARAFKPSPITFTIRKAESNQIVLHQAATLNVRVDRDSYPDAGLIWLEEINSGSYWVPISFKAENWKHEGLWPGQYIIQLKKSIPGTRKFETLAVKRVSLEEGDRKEIQFDRKNTYVLEGGVIQGGKAVKEGFVYIKAKRKPTQTTTLENGHFKFSGLEKDEYKLAYSPEKLKFFQEHQLNFVKVTLEKSISNHVLHVPVVLEVRGALDESHEGDKVILNARNRSGTSRRAQIKDGVFRLSKIMPSQYRLVLKNSDATRVHLLAEDLDLSQVKEDQDLGTFKRQQGGGGTVALKGISHGLSLDVGLGIYRVDPQRKFGKQMFSLNLSEKDVLFTGLPDGHYQFRLFIRKEAEPFVGTTWKDHTFRVKNQEVATFQIQLFWKKGLIISLEDKSRILESITLFDRKTGETILEQRVWPRRSHTQVVRISKGSWRVQVTSQQGQVWERMVETHDDSVTTLTLSGNGD